ncbi:putative probable phosphoglycerate mutase ARB_03491 [[Candida] railenensis]|uniref:Probable phosphoglycerate mutase ARB_03491 n=1 Tax=[Candida] railenensis TaxID=45579 RepID=A0A9P0QLE3_9ASCO|nr:putative probable phosphoglycerate mutase ARB_03491 [[Candida] railenensis]
MSLLVSTEIDYLDAHGNSDVVPVYKKLLSEVQDKRDPTTGKLLHPWKFEVVPGFFKQSDVATNDLKFNYATEDFGRTSSWAELISKLDGLNREAGPDESYKLLFLARHGQGFHNQIVEKYGIDAWNEKWYGLTTDGEVTYAPDPMLTELGINQAKENNAAWKEQVAQGCPIPSKFYVSPLQRSCHTLVHTWNGIKSQDVQPLVIESVRETIGRNLCDKRSTRTVIKERFGKENFIIDESVTENDELFRDDWRESISEQGIRCNGFLQYLFDKEWESSAVDKTKAIKDSVINVTSHAGTIRAFLTVIAHREFAISTGGMIPVVVKGTRKID